MPTSGGLMMELVQIAGPMGFFIWLVHRTTTHTMPRMAKSFEEVIERQRAEFRDMLNQQRKDYERLIHILAQQSNLKSNKCGYLLKMNDDEDEN